VRVHNLLLEDVGLVEEKYDRGLLKPGVGDDGFEQSFALLHSVLRQIRSTERGDVLGDRFSSWITTTELDAHLVVALSQDLVVLAERHQEDDGGDILEAVDPLPPL